MRHKKRKLNCTVVNHRMSASAFHPGPTGGESNEKLSEELGIGKRKRTANVMYDSKNFWHHNDEDNSDDEMYS